MSVEVDARDSRAFCPGDSDERAPDAASDVRNVHPRLQSKQFGDCQVLSLLRLAQSLPGPTRGEVKRRAPAELVEPSDDIVETTDEPRLLDGATLRVPQMREARPDPGFLEWRFDKFKAVQD